MESAELLQTAIVRMRVKNTAKSTPQTATFVPEDAHKQLYPILEIWDAERDDPDINDKTKFIHDFLTDEQGTARDKIMSILNELPALSNESTINRIWKYCRLKEERNKTIKRAEMLNERLRKI